MHTQQPLLEAGVPAEDVRAIMSHGWGICTDVQPQTNMEKSLFTVDELTGIIQACARMRPHGITDLEVKSFMKKFKDKKFAAKCDREIIRKGCELLGMTVNDVAQISDLVWELTVEGDLTLMGSPPEGSVNRTVSEQLGIPAITLETWRGEALKERVARQIRFVEKVLTFYGML